MKRILQKGNQRFELNFVFVLQFSEHEEDELFKIIQVYMLVNLEQVVDTKLSLFPS